MKRSNALILFTVSTMILLAVDRVTKVIAVDVLTDSGPTVFLPALLDFVLVYNTGGAFGLFEGGATLFVGVAVLAVIVIIAYLVRAKQLHLPVVFALSLISAGALGNAYDRLMIGAVPDFIHTLFMEFPVFNVADCLLTVGEIVLIITVAYYWFVWPKTQETVSSESDEHEKGASLKGVDDMNGEIPKTP